MNILAIVQWLIRHYKIAGKAILALSVAFLLGWSISLHNKNKMLSERLEMAQNNVEAYLDALVGSLLASNVLKLDMEELKHQNDSIIVELDKIRAQNKINAKNLTTAATQTLIINVNNSKGVRGDILTIIKDTVYSDTLCFNDLTKVYYTIGKDSVDMTLDINNTQYLYIFKHKEYVHKKNFLQRLFTLDWKKRTTYKYNIVNTNELVDTKDVRIIESIDK